MSIARHHNEWLSLLEVSGPFLSMPVLMRVFPQGLEALDRDMLAELRQAYNEWLDDQNSLRPTPAIHSVWVRYVLERVLGLEKANLLEGPAIPANLKTFVAEQGETLSPDLVIVPHPQPRSGVAAQRDGERGARMLVQIHPIGQGLEKTMQGRHWKASPAMRMLELLRATGVQLGLVTNGEQWMLVNAPRGETSAFVSWYAALWLEEPLTLRAFCSLLSASRFFSVADKDTLEGMLKASVDEQQEVTDQLGYQVRRAVDVLIRAVDKADQDRGRTLLKDIGESELYEAALTVMMRLVFLFSAEERGLLLLGDPLYDQNYAVSTLRAQLRETADQQGEEVLERRFDAWCRLLATFRAVHDGIHHDRLNLPAYGGSLFDPDRYPFLEGRVSRQYAEAESISRQDAKAQREISNKKNSASFASLRDHQGESLANSASLREPKEKPLAPLREQDASEPLPISNRTVLHLLEALQILRVKVPGGGPAEARRLSFRALDVEQIGHVYEGLLDHIAVRASEPVLGLSGTREKEPEIPLSELERFFSRQDAKAQREIKNKENLANFAPLRDPSKESLADLASLREPEFFAYLKEQTGRSENALRRAWQTEPDALALQRLQIACNNDPKIFAQVVKYAGLIREDDFGYPAVFLPGSVYVTAGATRRATGTHYTPRSLTEPIVQHTLEPLVYIGPAEGLPREQWKLRSPAELLELKICDMAMGSAGFLVQVIRYLSERLVEAWEEIISRQDAKAEIISRQDAKAEIISRQDAKAQREIKSKENLANLASLRDPSKENLAPFATLREIYITPEGQPATGAPGETIIPRDDEERLILARRLVADRCIYGVDKNPLAVEIAKLSIWLTTMDKGRPFTFLDHALKCGDSLVGASEDDFLRWAHGWQAAEATLFDAELQKQVELAREKRRQLEAFTVREVRDAEHKAALLQEAEAALERVKLGCDLLTGARLLGLSKKEVEDLQVNLLFPYMAGAFDPHSPNPLPPLPMGEGLGVRGEGMGVRALAAARKTRAFHWQFEFPEVFEQGGFSAFVGNPPFLGGQRITGEFGVPYRDYLVEYVADGKRGSADLCAYFFLRCFQLLCRNGKMGLIATNTIAQGDTREVGLEAIDRRGGVIYRAYPSLPWPGQAAVYVSVVHLSRGALGGARQLDERPVRRITPLLDSAEALGSPQRLAANAGKSFQGSIVLGMGFVLTPEEAQALIEKDPRNQEVLFPYLNGEDLNSRPDQSPSRWVINFFDWPLEKAQEYPDCFRIVEEKVKPERKKLIGRNPIGTKRGTYWWQYGSEAKKLYLAIAPLERVLVLTLVSRTVAFASVLNGWVFAHRLVVFPFSQKAEFCLLQSAFHYFWAWKYSSTLKMDLNYSPSDCFETFPFPEDLAVLESPGSAYHDYRSQIMLARQEGLTATYNRFHNPKEKASDIARLRELHVEMDNAVAAAYGWGDLDLGHGFHETPQGIRFTISEEARREVLARLLRLNHERYEEEVRQGLHEKKNSKAGKGKKGKSVREEPGQYEMF